jgi:hypothetical protein
MRTRRRWYVAEAVAAEALATVLVQVPNLQIIHKEAHVTYARTESNSEQGMLAGQRDHTYETSKTILGQPSMDLVK